MNETQILLTISHKKPLPEEATDVVAQRFYGWAYSRGVEVSVNAAIASSKRLVCTYPDCNCPFDAPADPSWCARKLPKA